MSFLFFVFFVIIKHSENKKAKKTKKNAINYFYLIPKATIPFAFGNGVTKNITSLDTF